MDKQLTKREANKARRRAAIVEIATRSFFERGFAGTSMSAISDELGGSKATLWAHFPSKHDLFVAVVEDQIAQFAAAIEDVLRGQTFSNAALRRFCRRFLELVLRPDPVSLFRLIVGESERFPELSEVFYARGPQKLRDAVTAFYATGFASAEAERLTELTMAALLGFRSDALIRPIRPGQAEAERFVNNLLEHLRLPEPLPGTACTPSA